MFNAAEALGLILYDASQLPEPSNTEEVKAQYPEAEVHLIGVDLEEFAKEAEELGLNFSSILTKALRQEIKQIKEA
jgi:hypothetical protein